MKSILFHFFIFVVIFAALVGLKWQYSYHFSSKSYGMSGYLAQEKTDILFIGSSITRHAFSPKIIDSITQKSSYLISYNGNGPHFEYDMLKYILTEPSIKKPSVVVMEGYPYSNIVHLKLSDVRILNDAPPALKKNLFSTLLYSNPHLPFTDIAYLLLSNNEGIFSYPFTGHYLYKLSYKGGYQQKTSESITEERFKAIKDPLPKVYTENLKLNDTALVAQKEIVNLCKQHNVRLIFINSPISGYITEQMPFSKADSLFQQYVKDSLQVTSIYGMNDFDFDRKNAQLFSNATHLSTKGRDIYSIQVANRLKNDGF